MAVSAVSYGDPANVYECVEYDGTNASDVYDYASEHNTYSLSARLRVDGTDLYATFASFSQDNIGNVGLVGTHEAKLEVGDKLIFHVGGGEYEFVGVWNEETLVPLA